MSSSRCTLPIHTPDAHSFTITCECGRARLACCPPSRNQQLAPADPALCCRCECDRGRAGQAPQTRRARRRLCVPWQTNTHTDGPAAAEAANIFTAQPAHRDTVCTRTHALRFFSPRHRPPPPRRLLTRLLCGLQLVRSGRARSQHMCTRRCCSRLFTSRAGPPLAFVSRTAFRPQHVCPVQYSDHV